jgi:predicted transcriptional regulator
MAEVYFTPRELDVMSVLWERESATVAEVREALQEELAYTSVLSALQTLEKKGFVRHEQEAAGGSALTRIVEKVFHGSASMLLAQLVSERKVPAEELERMQKLLAERLREEER